MACPYRLCLIRTLLPALMLWPAPAVAQEQAPAVSPPAVPAPITTELRTQLGLSVNNLGLQQSLEWSRRRLLKPQAGPLLSDAHVSFGLSTSVSPAYLRAGVWGEFAPLSIFSLRVGIEPAQFFGTFDSLMGFDRQDEPFDTDARKARGGAKAGRVLRLYATPTLGIRTGHILAGVSGDLERWSSSSDGAFFYEPVRDTLLEAEGTGLVSSRAIVIYEHLTSAGTTLGLGGIHTFQRVDGRSLNQVQRLGVLAMLHSDGRLLRLTQPTVNVIIANYLDDPSKKGGWTAILTVATTLRRR